MPDTIRITAAHEKWRFECLATDRYGAREGHTNWFPIDGKFRCIGCSEAARNDPEINPEYERLRDKKTGEIVERDEIELAIGPSPTPTRV